MHRYQPYLNQTPIQSDPIPESTAKARETPIPIPVQEFSYSESPIASICKPAN